MELLVHYRGTLITAVIAVAVGLASYAVVSSDPLAGHRDRSFTMDFSRVYEVDPALIHYAQTREFSVSMDQPRCISVGPEDQIFVGGDQTVGLYRQDGTTLAMIPTEGRPSCLAVGNDQHLAPGRIYVGSGNRIEVFDRDGSRVATWNVPTDAAILASIAVADESVFVADSGNRVVWRFGPSGELQGTIGNAEAGGRTFNVPSTTFDIAIGSNGQLHVANPGALRIETYTFDGALQARWGNPGAAIESFFGCCNPSQFAVLPGGEIVTSEKGVPRIKAYSEYGEFRSVVAGPQQLGIAQSELGDARPHQAGVVFDVAADSQGRVLVLDPRRKSVRIFMRRDEHTGGIDIHSFPGSAWEHTGREAPPCGSHATCGRATPASRSKAEPWNEDAAPLIHLFPGSAWEHTAREAPPCGSHATCGRATPASRSKAEPWNEDAAPLAHLFPGSAWEHTAREASPRGSHAACGRATPASRSKAEPWNEVAAPLIHLFPGSAWEHTAREAPPRGSHVACGRATPASRSKAEPWNEVAAPLIHLFPGSALEHTAREAPPRGSHAACRRATPASRSKAEPWNEVAAPLAHLFPGSAWEHTAREAPPRGSHVACGRATSALRSKAEPWNEVAAPLAHASRWHRVEGESDDT